VFIQETLIFTYNPQDSQSDPGSPTKKSSLIIAAKEVDALVQPVSQLRSCFPLSVERIGEDFEDLEDEEDERMLRMIMTGEYPDAEIDRILETFSMSGQQNVILNGEFLENDIRLSESVREAIEQIKQVQKPSAGKLAENSKVKFLTRYMDTAELLGISHTVEYLLPALVELVPI
jgi:hypothetical protein